MKRMVSPWQRGYVHLGNLTALVVSSEDGDAVLVAHLQADEKGNCFHRVVTTIDVVSHEEVVGIRRLASNSEQLDEVIPLAMDVAAHRHWAAHALHVRLILKDFTSLITSTHQFEVNIATKLTKREANCGSVLHLETPDSRRPFCPQNARLLHMQLAHRIAINSIFAATCPLPQCGGAEAITGRNKQGGRRSTRAPASAYEEKRRESGKRAQHFLSLVPSHRASLSLAPIEVCSYRVSQSIGRVHRQIECPC